MQCFDPQSHIYSRIYCSLKDFLISSQDVSAHNCKGAVPVDSNIGKTLIYTGILQILSLALPICTWKSWGAFPWPQFTFWMYNETWGTGSLEWFGGFHCPYISVCHNDSTNKKMLEWFIVSPLHPCLRHVPCYIFPFFSSTYLGTGLFFDWEVKLFPMHS